MTDKQIIIDGCDVSGCPFYMDNGECINENVYPDYCKACSNCTYKLEQQLDQLKAENDDLKKCYKNNSALLDFEETNTTKLVNKVMKLEKTLTEIKEIAEKKCLGCTKFCNDDNIKFCVIKQILQKISEVLDGNT